MISVNDIICCPVCRGGLDAELRCRGCGERFALEDGIYRLVSLKVSDMTEFTGDKDWDGEYKPGVDQDENGKTYSDYLNEETKAARDAWAARFRERLGALRGNVLDIATGPGSNLRYLLESGGDFRPIATDIFPEELRYARGRLAAEHGIKREFAAVATDIKHLAFRAGVMDAATTLGGLQEVSNSGAAAAEIRRVMKSGARLLAMTCAYARDSASARRAEGFGHLRGVIQELLIEDLAAAGFVNISAERVARGVLAANPRDLTPVAGDVMYYDIIEAFVK